MAIGAATILRAPIREDPTQRDFVFLKERHHLVIEQLRRCQRRFPIVELGKGHLTIGIHEGLLIDTSYALQRPNVDCILCPTIPRTLTLKLPLRLFINFGFLECGQLRFGQNMTLLCYFGFSGPQTFGEVFQMMAFPHTADTCCRDRNPALG